MELIGSILGKNSNNPNALKRSDSSGSLKASSEWINASSRIKNPIFSQDALFQPSKKSVKETNKQDIYTTSAKIPTIIQPPSLKKGIEVYRQLNLLYKKNMSELNLITDMFQKTSSFTKSDENSVKNLSSVLQPVTSSLKNQSLGISSSLKKWSINEYLNNNLKSRNNGNLLNKNTDSYLKSWYSSSSALHAFSDLFTKTSKTPLISSTLTNPLKTFYTSHADKTSLI